MSDARWHLLVPGGLEVLTGGTRYDRRMVEALQAQGQPVSAQGLPGRFPRTDATAQAAIDATLRALPDDAITLVDGLALGDADAVYARHAGRLRLLALIHHPLADEAGLDATERAALLAAETRSLALVHGVVVTSAFTARRLQALGLSGHSPSVAPPGTDPAPLAAGSGQPPRLLCVGAVTPRKSQDLLVTALAGVRERAWTCDCIGRLDQAPMYAQSVAEAIREHGLEDRLRLCGAVDDAALAEAYHRADLFVLPSRYEGYGMVITEAVARGLPVVTTDGGALADTLPAGAGLQVPAGDAAALSAALARLLDDPGERARLAAGARTARAELPDWPAAAAGLAAAVAQELANG